MITNIIDKIELPETNTMSAADVYRNKILVDKIKRLKKMNKLVKKLFPDITSREVFMQEYSRLVAKEKPIEQSNQIHKVG